ncbi:AzlD domain-containing protein [Pseudoroseicyclus aestuarii]|uniref:Branched-subunit amino acid transport protein n=1 Tax=Pseudoroseicyclus aestuarii TaxID=1795041 RepID=A0A318SW96_9RHOB|nr:AzlD domain-containing protein [Pseudoroseicyclus aestuarii]PYE84659.1 branched-subunit amino acid transport protein [Pseudoroseicyclus aestuarii]
MIPTWLIWTVIALLGVGTLLLRFSFLGLIGQRPLPDWALRHLRYTAVAVLPGLVAPLVLWPEATGGATDPARLLSALAVLGVGVLSRSTIGAMLAGAATLYAVLILLAVV